MIQSYNAYNQKRIETINELPVEHRERRITDICCCGLGVIFGLILFILACILFNRNNILRSNYPVDSDGHICLYDHNNDGQLRPFLYFNDLSNPLTSGKCVSDCPQQGQQSQCWESSCNLEYYPNYPHSDRLGSFCMPEDETAKSKLINDTGINLFDDAIKALDILMISFAIACLIGLIWLIFVHYLPTVAVWVAMICAIIVLITTAIVFFVDAKNSLWRVTGWAIFLGIVALIVALLLIFYLAVHRDRLRYCGIFLKNASIMIKEKCIIVGYIALFMVLTIIFCILIVFQYLAFSSVAEPYKSDSSVYLTLTRSFWFMLPLVIETLWGLSFLRDSFNFCVSGVAIQWYFRKEVNCCYPLSALFTKHFGSVAGGSFINAFLYFPNLFVNLFCNNKDNFCCNCLDLPREDAYPYIYMTSTSYCPSVRQVQYLCNRSRICRGNESANTFYALAARIFISLLTVLIVFGIMESKMTGGVVNAYVLLGVFFMSLFVTCYFVDLHVDVAQALMIAFLAEWDLEQDNYLHMNLAREEMKKAINDIDHEIEIKDIAKANKKLQNHSFKH